MLKIVKNLSLGKHEMACLFTIFSVFMFVAIPRLMFPELNHGDEYSDANLLDGTANIIKFGVLKTKMFPIIRICSDKLEPAYTNLAPMPDFFNLVLRKLFQTDSLYLFRFFALLCSFFTVVFWYKSIKLIFSDYFLAFLFVFFFLVNPFFLYGIDSMYEFAYSEMFRAIIVYLTVIWIKSKQTQKGYKLIWLWFCLFMSSLISFEYILFNAVLVVGLPLCLSKVYSKGTSYREFHKDIFILALAPFTAIVMFLMHNVWYYGSVSSLVDKVWSRVVARTIGGGEMTSPLAFVSWFKIVILRNLNLSLFVDKILYLAFFMLAVVNFKSLDSTYKERIVLVSKFILLFFLSGITWYVFFASHAYSHAFVHFLVRHIVPVAAMLMAVIPYVLCLAFFKRKAKFIFLTILLVLCLAVGWQGIEKSGVPVTPNSIAMNKDFNLFRDSLLALRDISKEGDEIAINYFRFPFVRHYTQRNIVSVFDKQRLESLERKPEYFLLLPYPGKRTKDLLDYLKIDYFAISQSASRRYPAIVFKRKNLNKSN